MSESLDLPLASISRIVKAALPPGATLSKEVKQSLGKAAALFILYLSSTANDVCRTHRRSTVSGDDVLAAVEECEFDMFLEPLQVYLKQFREEAAKKKKTKAGMEGETGEGGATAAAAPKKRRAPAAAAKDAAGAASTPAHAPASATAADSASKRAKLDAADDRSQPQHPQQHHAHLGGMDEDPSDSRQPSDEDDADD